MSFWISTQNSSCDQMTILQWILKIQSLDTKVQLISNLYIFDWNVQCLYTIDIQQMFFKHPVDS